MTSDTDAQSRLYRETLESLSESIKLHQRQRTMSATIAAQQFIEPILTIDPNAGVESAEVETNILQQTPIAVQNSDRTGPGKQMLLSNDNFLGQSAVGGVYHEYQEYDWSEFSMQFMDNFTMDFSNGLQ